MYINDISVQPFGAEDLFARDRYSTRQPFLSSKFKDEISRDHDKDFDLQNRQQGRALIYQI